MVTMVNIGGGSVFQGLQDSFYIKYLNLVMTCFTGQKCKKTFARNSKLGMLLPWAVFHVSMSGAFGRSLLRKDKLPLINFALDSLYSILPWMKIYFWSVHM